MLSLREALIVVPKQDNKGRSGLSARDAVVRQCVSNFGGATVLSAEGAWLGDDRLYQEPVWLVMTACEPTSETVAILAGIADDMGEALEQEAVYVRYPDGTVDIRDTVSRWTKRALEKAPDLVAA